jgi:hypothetical protein
MNKKILFSILLVSILLSCNQKKDKQKADKILTEWLGKSIKFPNNMLLSIYEKDTLIPDFLSKPYKVLLYVDSSGCASCKLKLSDWQKIIGETNSTMKNKLSFVFSFQPRSNDELVYLFHCDRFNYPVFIDKTNEMNNLNHFPEDETYQCFLLDSTNKVIAVGNPIRNPKVWNLYKQIITGIRNNHDKGSTLVEVKNSEVELGEIKSGAKQKIVFYLKNVGKKPLIISNVTTSCDCTIAKYNKKPIPVGQTATVVLEYKPNSLGYFSKTADVVCNVPEGYVRLKISGEVVKNKEIVSS